MPGRGRCSAKRHIGSPAAVADGWLTLHRRAEGPPNTGGVYFLGRRSSPIPVPLCVRRSATYDAWTPKVSIQARATTDTFVYASATRGFKSGGFNPSWPEPDGRIAPSSPGASREASNRRWPAGGSSQHRGVLQRPSRSAGAVVHPSGPVRHHNAASADVRGVEAEVAARGADPAVGTCLMARRDLSSLPCRRGAAGRSMRTATA